MIHGIVAWLPRAIVALVIVVVVVAMAMVVVVAIAMAMAMAMAMAIARAVRDIVQAALGGMSYGRFLATAAWAFIVALGVIAALGQAGIATAITGPVLTAVLATIAGIAIVGVGGGLITPMRSRWGRWLSVAESESGKAKQQITAYQQGREDARRAMPSAQERTERGRRGEGGEGGQIGGGGAPTV